MKVIQKTTALTVAVCMILSVLPIVGVSAAFENTHVNTGDQREDLIAVAATQIGYEDGSLEGTDLDADTNLTKYGVWYDETCGTGDGTYNEAVWDGMFIAWCAAQAGISSDIVPYGAYLPFMVNSFKNKGVWQDSAYRGGSYTPARGDIVFFASAGSELAAKAGIITKVENGYITAIFGNEGNPYYGCGCCDQVREKTVSVEYMRIYGYAVPAYTVNDARDVLEVADTAVSVEDGVIYGLQVGTTAQALLDNIRSEFAVTVDGDGVLKTGMTVQVKNGDAVVATFVVAVHGDADGDGDSDTADSRLVLMNITGDTFDSAQKRACDINGSGSVDTLDVRYMLKASL